MDDTVRPATEEDVAAAVADALAEGAALEVAGAGSKRGLGRPVRAARRLDLSALAGITLYEPDELVLAARAGTTLAEIGEVLAARGQRLAFEPPDWGPLYGGARGAGTLGGAIAANLSGPGRLRNGAARDHVLGLRAVTGRGEIVRMGGRVVKNVTGYDLCKLLTGSFGTLAAMTEITVKVLPAPEKVRTILVAGLDFARAREAMDDALRGPHDVSAAAYLPAGVAARSAVARVSGAGGAVAALRVEGPAPSVAARCAALKAALSRSGPVEELHFHNSRTLWAEIGDGTLLAKDGDPLWRLSVPPASGPEVAAALEAVTGVEYAADWGGGLLWARVPSAAQAAGEGGVRAAVAESGGHATLIRADEAVRAAVPVFQPQEAGVARLARRVKEGFDPRGLLNPGRMVEGV